MPKAVTTFVERMQRLIAGFTIAQRTIALIGVAVLAMGIFAIASWLARPTLTPLFSGLSASDANAVVEQLRAASVQYELADGGATVLVPEDDVYEQRLVAASAGLPSGGTTGYSLLDDMGVTTSEFQQSVTYKRAIEGELAATISSLEGVTAASVQLAIPEESVFVAETIPPTASVFVQTRDGATLSTKQVEAIVHLTSASVSGMEAADVAVVDQAGRTLSAVGVGAVGGADQQAGDYEQRVASSIQRMLDSVVGVGNATVSVTAEIDRSVSERTEEVYTPAEGTPPSTEQVRTETQGRGDIDAGVLGPDNIAVPADEAAGGYESTEETRTNVVNRAVESTETPAGSVLRQSVSVAVAVGAADGIGMAQLRDLVSTAAGINPERGDVVTVERVAFSQHDAEAAQTALQAAKEAAEAERRAALMRTIVIAAAVALPLLAVTITLLVRKRRKNEIEAEFDELFGERPPPLSTFAVQDPPPQLTSASPTVPLTELEPEPELDPEPGPEPAQVSLQRRRAELDALSRTDPKRTAELLRTLIDERQPV